MADLFDEEYLKSLMQNISLPVAIDYITKAVDNHKQKVNELENIINLQKTSISGESYTINQLKTENAKLVSQARSLSSEKFELSEQVLDLTVKNAKLVQENKNLNENLELFNRTKAELEAKSKALCEEKTRTDKIKSDINKAKSKRLNTYSYFLKNLQMIAKKLNLIVLDDSKFEDPEDYERQRILNMDKIILSLIKHYGIDKDLAKKN